LAPGIAAERAGTPIDLARVTAHLTHLRAHADRLLIEGAGGLFTPIAKTATGHVMIVDLIATLGMPVLIVARSGLGTLNHSLLTVSELKRRAIPIVGLVLNQHAPASGIAESTNRETLGRLLPDLPIYGPFPHLLSITATTLQTAANAVFANFQLA